MKASALMTFEAVKRKLKQREKTKRETEEGGCCLRQRHKSTVSKAIKRTF